MKAPVFLTAAWRNLVMLNYEVDPAILASRVPRATEIDTFEGRAFVSIVGFLFLDTKVLGLPIPFHRDFEELNLRFYVRREVKGELRRGVVFVKEIVPRSAIAWVARTVYNENYVAMPMRHHVRLPVPGGDGRVEYSWDSGDRWNRVSARIAGPPEPMRPASEEEFIAEHYWGYAAQRGGGTVEYEVEHPPWRVWRALDPALDCDAPRLYGEEFRAPLLLPSRLGLRRGRIGDRGEAGNESRLRRQVEWAKGQRPKQAATGSGTAAARTRWPALPRRIVRLPYQLLTSPRSRGSARLLWPMAFGLRPSVCLIAYHSPMPTYRYVTADVFTSTRFCGNQLAVLTDARGLTGEEMQTIAREMNYSETVFVLPPGDAAHARRLRIFTPASELPFAGHPTVGAAIVLVEEGLVAAPGKSTRIVFEEGVGPVPVTITRDADGRLVAELTAAKPPERLDGAASLDDLAAALTLAPGDFVAPAEVWSCGVPFTVVEVRDRRAMGRIRLDRRAFSDHLASSASPDVHVVCRDPETPGADLRVRMFAPLLGVDEDPATGSAAAALAGWLGRGMSDGEHSFMLEQGIEMGRASYLRVVASVERGRVVESRVAGHAVIVCRGEMAVR